MDLNSIKIIREYRTYMHCILKLASRLISTATHISANNLYRDPRVALTLKVKEAILGPSTSHGRHFGFYVLLLHLLGLKLISIILTTAQKRCNSLLTISSFSAQPPPPSEEKMEGLSRKEKELLKGYSGASGQW